MTWTHFLSWTAAGLAAVWLVELVVFGVAWLAWHMHDRRQRR